MGLVTRPIRLGTEKDVSELSVPSRTGRVVLFSIYPRNERHVMVKRSCYVPPFSIPRHFFRGPPRMARAFNKMFTKPASMAPAFQINTQNAYRHAQRLHRNSKQATIRNVFACAGTQFRRPSSKSSNERFRATRNRSFWTDSVRCSGPVGLVRSRARSRRGRSVRKIEPISLAHRNRGAKSMAAFGPKSAIAAMPAQIGSNRGR